MANFTQDQLTKLKAAYARGVLELREGDTWIKYNSMSEMRQAIKEIEAELSSNVPRGSRRVVVNKGY